jgi:PelA/Pel-15E family pectate lyase
MARSSGIRTRTYETVPSKLDQVSPRPILTRRASEGGTRRRAGSGCASGAGLGKRHSRGRATIPQAISSLARRVSMAAAIARHTRAFAVFLVISAAITGALAADAPWKTYANKPDEWYRGREGRAVAANVLSYQSDQGSWPKNLDTTAQAFTGDRRSLQGTFDNGATFGELRFLARIYAVTQDAGYRDAFLKGLDHVLRAQYPTGGWPQYFPPGKGYHRHITFNDGAIVNILEFLSDVAHSPQFSFVDKARRSAAGQCVHSGIECILKCQIKVNGERTIWCAQHDEKTLEPRWGRSYEPPALTSAESAGILRLLMSQENPSPEIKQAVHAGARWFLDSRISGIKQIHVNRDKVIVKDKDAPALWARFYEIGTNRPIFCGRDGIIKYDIAEIEAERRNGYAWYGTWGNDVASRYARWTERWDTKIAPSP